MATYTSTAGSNDELKYTYTYDGNGNITKITCDGKEIRYVYDDLGQLIREDNSVRNQTYVYTYDNAGNILSKKTYALTAAGSTPTSPTSTNTYGYGNANWGDLLTSFNGNAITYDAIGNPLSYNNGTSYTYNFTWENGRRLASATYGSNTITYTYNDEDTRTSKNVSGTEHVYHLDGSRIIAEEWGNSLCIYLYDAEGTPVGMQYRSKSMAEGVFHTFWFEKNLQGDIVAVYDDSGNKLYSYAYDAWGNCVATRHSTSTAARYAQYNPFRYRGYYYDTETGFYYLQSRYYDPTVGRFINADGITTIIATPQGFTDKNLFAYCDNNPVLRFDNDGEFWHIVIGAAIGAAVNFTVSVVSDVIEGGWNNIDYLDAGIAAGIGALEGGLCAAGVPVPVLALVNAGCSAAESIYHDVKDNINKKESNSALDIITHATIDAGISALFTVAGGASNGREISALRKSAQSAQKSLNSGGLHPAVKAGMKSAVKTYSNALKPFAKDCAIDTAISTPLSTFLSKYGTNVYDYICEGR